MHRNLGKEEVDLCPLIFIPIILSELNCSMIFRHSMEIKCFVYTIIMPENRKRIKSYQIHLQITAFQNTIGREPLGKLPFNQTP